MKVLADPKADFKAMREAAYNLGHFGEQRTIATTVWSDWLIKQNQGPNPVVEKFSKPTVAEAILAAMDRDLSHHDTGKHNQLYDYDRRHIEDNYFEPLIHLADKRIESELNRRFKSEPNIRMQRKYAFACHVLGNSSPMISYAKEIEKGSLRLPGNNEPNTNENDQPGNVELTGIVDYLTKANMPECDSALFALAAPNHPYHSLTVNCVFRSMGIGKEIGIGHPFCLAILRAALNDTKPTGFTWRIEQGVLECTGDQGSSSQSIPDFLTNPAVRREQAVERVCDDAAVKVGELVFGSPFYNPLLKDSEKRLAAIKILLDRYGVHFRIMSDSEKELVGLFPREPKFAPAILPLDHAATMQDVDRGLAIFQLDGKGKPAGMKLPAVATLKHEGQNKQRLRVLVVQAEKSAEGKTTCGIISEHEIITIDGEELIDIKSIPK